MPLINLKTNLKSLKFGRDRPGGGSSNQPYIKSKIPSQNSDSSSILSTGGKDSLLRGGLLAPIRAAEDVSRLTQMFTDTKSVNGLLFIAKQNVLSRLSVHTEASTGIAYGFGKINQGVYLPTSTIGQSLVGFTGTHLNSFGINPLSPMTGVDGTDGGNTLGINRYEEKVKYWRGEMSRLGILHEAIFAKNIKDKKLSFGTINTTGGSLIEYTGGPGAKLGIGKTRIKYADQRTVKDLKLLGGLRNFEGATTWTQQEISEVKPEDLFRTTKKTTDFRDKLVKSPTGKKVLGKLTNGYTDKIKMGQRVHSGDPGKSKDVSKYGLTYSSQKELSAPLDLITASPIYTQESPNYSITNERNDLCKFSIGVINNDADGETNFMHFRAFIDGFSDSYTADWGETQYVGRADKFYNYKGFGRSIDLSFTVAAQSKAELIPMYKKLNYLASSLAPSYSQGGFMQGNLVRLTVGGYLYNQVGILKGITYTIPQESPWEIGLDDKLGNDNTVKELPHIIKVSGFQFTPIQDFVPQVADPEAQFNTRFISLANGSTAKNTNYEKK